MTLSLMVLFPACGAIPPVPPPPTRVPALHQEAVKGRMTITILDVGQGDAALIETPGGARALIDGGPPGAGRAVILPFLAAHGIAHLDATIASHYDVDHIGGLPEVYDGPDGVADTGDDFVPAACWDGGGDVPADHPAKRRYAERRGRCHQVASAGMTLRLDADITLTVLAANGALADGRTIAADPADDNARSIALLVEDGAFRYYTAGDLPGGGGDPPFTTIDVETPLAALLHPVDVLHVSHHGSTTATNANLLAAAAPRAAVISVGNANPYGHPHRSVLARLAGLGIPIYLTEHGDNDLPGAAVVNNGPITIETDGAGFTVR